MTKTIKELKQLLENAEEEFNILHTENKRLKSHVHQLVNEVSMSIKANKSFFNQSKSSFSTPLPNINGKRESVGEEDKLIQEGAFYTIRRTELFKMSLVKVFKYKSPISQVMLQLYPRQWESFHRLVSNSLCEGVGVSEGVSVDVSNTVHNTVGDKPIGKSVGDTVDNTKGDTNNSPTNTHTSNNPLTNTYTPNTHPHTSNISFLCNCSTNIFYFTNNTFYSLTDTQFIPSHPSSIQEDLYEYSQVPFIAYINHAFVISNNKLIKYDLQEKRIVGTTNKVVVTSKTHIDMRIIRIYCHSLTPYLMVFSSKILQVFSLNLELLSSSPVPENIITVSFFRDNIFYMLPKEIGVLRMEVVDRKNRDFKITPVCSVVTNSRNLAMSTCDNIIYAGTNGNHLKTFVFNNNKLEQVDVTLFDSNVICIRFFLFKRNKYVIVSCMNSSVYFYSLRSRKTMVYRGKENTIGIQVKENLVYLVENTGEVKVFSIS